MGRDAETVLCKEIEKENVGFVPRRICEVMQGITATSSTALRTPRGGGPEDKVPGEETYLSECQDPEPLKLDCPGECHVGLSVLKHVVQFALQPLQAHALALVDGDRPPQFERDLQPHRFLDGASPLAHFDRPFLLRDAVLHPGGELHDGQMLLVVGEGRDPSFRAVYKPEVCVHVLQEHHLRACSQPESRLRQTILSQLAQKGLHARVRRLKNVIFRARQQPKLLLVHLVHAVVRRKEQGRLYPRGGLQISRQLLEQCDAFSRGPPVANVIQEGDQGLLSLAKDTSELIAGFRPKKFLPDGMQEGIVVVSRPAAPADGGKLEEVACKNELDPSEWPVGLVLDVFGDLVQLAEQGAVQHADLVHNQDLHGRPVRCRGTVFPRALLQNLKRVVAQTDASERVECGSYRCTPVITT